MSLGEPRVVSASSSAWVAEIPLRSVPPQTRSQIQVRLAPSAAWTLAQRQAPNPKDFNFSIVEQAQGPALRIESTRGDSGFVELLIELQWPRGRMLREVGVLIDAAASSRFQPHSRVPGRIAVQSGDTASALALSHLESAQTLAQAMLALQQANPDAFIQGNVNRLRAGATLKLPAAEQIKSISVEQAREAIAQQMEAFALYRAELAAQSGPGAEVNRQAASGKVQPPQRDKPPAPVDRLTLSAPGSSADDQLAAQREAEQAAQRAAELNRNIQQLNRMVQSGGQAGESDGLPSPLPPVASPPPASAPVSEAPRSSQQPPWAALALVLALAALVCWRAMRRPVRNSPMADRQAKTSAPALKVDFDLELPPPEGLPPPPEGLPPLPDSVHQAPPPVARSANPPAASPIGPARSPADPMAGISLELPAAPTVQTEPIPTDPHALRLALIQALWDRGLPRTASVMARDMQDQAPAEWASQARQWLDERA